MKRKIEKYLESKEKSKYDNLDRILEMCLTGEIERLLSKYSGVGIYPSFYEDGKTIQLNYNYNNIYVIIDFFEDKYNLVVYYSGISVDDLEKLFIDYDYQDDFDLKNLIREIDLKIRNHPKLRDITLIEKKKKLYALIAWISWCLPIVICGSIAIYGFINKETIKGNIWWGIFFIAIPLIVGCIFDLKSKRLK